MGRIEFGWTHVASRVVGSSNALPRYPQEIGIQLAVGILIVEHRYCIRSRFDPQELAGSYFIGDRRSISAGCFPTVLRKAFGGGVESTEDLAVVVTQPHNVDMDDASLSRRRLRNTSRQRHQADGEN